MLRENEVATTIVDVAYHIHRQLGPRLLVGLSRDHEIRAGKERTAGPE